MYKAHLPTSRTASASHPFLPHRYAVALHRAHLLFCKSAEPIVVAPGRADSWSKEKKLRELLDGQKRCDGQLGTLLRELMQEGAVLVWVPPYVPPGAGVLGGGEVR